MSSRHDQAAQLRATTGRMPDGLPQLPALAVTGGKGGIGKTCIAVHLAVQFAQLGLKPLLVDLDLGLANADVLLGVSAGATLAEVALDAARIESVIVPTPWGVDLAPAASGREEMSRLGSDQLRRLFHSLAGLAPRYDLLVLDTAAGIGREVLAAVRAARVSLVATTPDPAAIADAYALVKVVEAQEPGRDLRLVVNQATTDEGTRTAGRLRQVATQYLRRDLPCLGLIPSDPRLAEAVRRRKLLTDATTPAGLALRALATRLKGERWR
jgi:flagellar biosynthesis protein FlhG